MFKTIFKPVAGILAAVFTFTTLVSDQAYAQALTPQILLPIPGSIVDVSPAFTPTLIKGLTLDAQDPFRLEFLIDSDSSIVHRTSQTNGERQATNDNFQKESLKLIKYFLASLALPEKKMWVNLSPVEKNRIIPESFGKTEMGRDLLAQDYILKQLTSTLMSPENEQGKRFWEKIYAKAAEQGITDIPVETFNKVWIVPQTGYFYEHDNTVFIVDAKLKVMLESDYLVQQKDVSLRGALPAGRQAEGDAAIFEITSQKTLAMTETQSIIRSTILPIIEKEINEGENFANLRQIYNAMLLGVWFKKRLKSHVLSQQYVNQEKIGGIDLAAPGATESIWNQYVASLHAGASDIIKEEYDPATQTVVPRKYFTGGAVALKDTAVLDPAQLIEDVEHLHHPNRVSVRIDGAMMSKPLSKSLKVQAADGTRMQIGIGETSDRLRLLVRISSFGFLKPNDEEKSFAKRDLDLNALAKIADHQALIKFLRDNDRDEVVDYIEMSMENLSDTYRLKNFMSYDLDHEEEEYSLSARLEYINFIRTELILDPYVLERLPTSLLLAVSKKFITGDKDKADDFLKRMFDVARKERCPVIKIPEDIVPGSYLSQFLPAAAVVSPVMYANVPKSSGVLSVIKPVDQPRLEKPQRVYHRETFIRNTKKELFELRLGSPLTTDMRAKDWKNVLDWMPDNAVEEAYYHPEEFYDECVAFLGSRDDVIEDRDDLLAEVMGNDQGQIVDKSVYFERLVNFMRDAGVAELYQDEMKSIENLDTRSLQDVLIAYIRAFGQSQAVRAMAIYFALNQKLKDQEGVDLEYPLGALVNNLHRRAGIIAAKSEKLGDKYLQDLHHGPRHAEDLLKIQYRIAFKRGVLGQIDWRVLIYADLIHDAYADRDLDHKKEAVQFVRRNFKRDLMHKITGAIDWHDVRTDAGARARAAAGIESQLLFDADQIEALSEKGVYRYLAVGAQRFDSYAEYLEFYRPYLLKNGQERYGSLYFPESKGLAKADYEKFLSYADKFSKEDLDSEKQNGVTGIAYFLYQNKDKTLEETIQVVEETLGDKTDEESEFTLNFFHRLKEIYGLDAAMMTRVEKLNIVRKFMNRFLAIRYLKLIDQVQDGLLDQWVTRIELKQTANLVSEIQAVLMGDLAYKASSAAFQKSHKQKRRAPGVSPDELSGMGFDFNVTYVDASRVVLLKLMWKEMQEHPDAFLKVQPETIVEQYGLDVRTINFWLEKLKRQNEPVQNVEAPLAPDLVVTDLDAINEDQGQEPEAQVSHDQEEVGVMDLDQFKEYLRTYPDYVLPFTVFEASRLIDPKVRKFFNRQEKLFERLRAIAKSVNKVFHRTPLWDSQIQFKYDFKMNPSDFEDLTPEDVSNLYGINVYTIVKWAVDRKRTLNWKGTFFEWLVQHRWKRVWNEDWEDAIEKAGLSGQDMSQVLRSFHIRLTSKQGIEDIVTIGQDKEGFFLWLMDHQNTKVSATDRQIIIEKHALAGDFIKVFWDFWMIDYSEYSPPRSQFFRTTPSKKEFFLMAWIKVALRFLSGDRAMLSDEDYHAALVWTLAVRNGSSSIKSLWDLSIEELESRYRQAHPFSLRNPRDVLENKFKGFEILVTLAGFRSILKNQFGSSGINGQAVQESVPFLKEWDFLAPDGTPMQIHLEDKGGEFIFFNVSILNDESQYIPVLSKPERFGKNKQFSHVTLDLLNDYDQFRQFVRQYAAPEAQNKIARLILNNSRFGRSNNFSVDPSLADYVKEKVPGMDFPLAQLALVKDVEKFKRDVEDGRNGAYSRRIDEVLSKIVVDYVFGESSVNQAMMAGSVQGQSPEQQERKSKFIRYIETQEEVLPLTIDGAVKLFKSTKTTLYRWLQEYNQQNNSQKTFSRKPFYRSKGEKSQALSNYFRKLVKKGQKKSPKSDVVLAKKYGLSKSFVGNMRRDEFGLKSSIFSDLKRADHLEKFLKKYLIEHNKKYYGEDYKKYQEAVTYVPELTSEILMQRFEGVSRQTVFNFLGRLNMEIRASHENIETAMFRKWLKMKEAKGEKVIYYSPVELRAHFALPHKIVMKILREIPSLQYPTSPHGDAALRLFKFIRAYRGQAIAYDMEQLKQEFGLREVTIQKYAEFFNVVVADQTSDVPIVIKKGDLKYRDEDLKNVLKRSKEYKKNNAMMAGETQELLRAASQDKNLGVIPLDWNKFSFTREEFFQSRYKLTDEDKKWILIPYLAQENQLKNIPFDILESMVLGNDNFQKRQQDINQFYFDQLQGNLLTDYDYLILFQGAVNVVNQIHDSGIGQVIWAGDSAKNIVAPLFQYYWEKLYGEEPIVTGALTDDKSYKKVIGSLIDADAWSSVSRSLSQDAQRLGLDPKLPLVFVDDLAVTGQKLFNFYNILKTFGCDNVWTAAFLFPEIPEEYRVTYFIEGEPVSDEQDRIMDAVLHDEKSAKLMAAVVQYAIENNIDFAMMAGETNDSNQVQREDSDAIYLGALVKQVGFQEAHPDDLRDAEQQLLDVNGDARGTLILNASWPDKRKDQAMMLVDKHMKYRSALVSIVVRGVIYKMPKRMQAFKYKKWVDHETGDGENRHQRYMKYQRRLEKRTAQARAKMIARLVFMKSLEQIMDHHTGGVDLNVDNADIRIQHDINGFKFPKIDPAMMKQPLDHLIPVILDIQPISIHDVGMLLGLNLPEEKTNDTEFGRDAAKEPEKFAAL